MRALQLTSIGGLQAGILPATGAAQTTTIDMNAMMSLMITMMIIVMMMKMMSGAMTSVTGPAR
jgi:hypothetical protein